MEFYREELEEQKRLVLFRNKLKKQKEIHNEKELLAKQTEFLKTKLNEEEEFQLNNFPKKHIQRHLLDSSLMQKLHYAACQKEELEKDKQKIKNEYENTLQNSGEKDRTNENTNRLRVHAESCFDQRKDSNKLKLRKLPKPEEIPSYRGANRANYFGLARIPYSKGEAKTDNLLDTSLRSEGILKSQVWDEKQKLNQSLVFPILDIPHHKTRRHFKNTRYMCHANLWEYDPEPEIRAAGRPYQSPTYNIINGNLSYEWEKKAESVFLEQQQPPAFLKEKYVRQFPLNRMPNSFMKILMEPKNKLIGYQ